MSAPFTPFFIQIATCGMGGSVIGAGTSLYGLTPDGQVYEWKYVRDQGALGSGSMRWVLLENPHD